jgi:hypothetical protein
MGPEDGLHHRKLISQVRLRKVYEYIPKMNMGTLSSEFLPQSHTAVEHKINVPARRYGDTRREYTD